MAKQSNEVRTRFAPSPTGLLHVGSLRTALYAYLFAKQNNGVFILRIEDTDRARYKAEAEDNMLETLETFGLTPFDGPYRQSEKLEVYEKYAHELNNKGFVYEDEGALRFKMNREGITEFDDIVRGRIKIENKEQEDFVILKSDGFPTYNFAHLVDDHEMGITHVIRGEEFIPSMPKYLALHQALDWDIPQYAHLPLLVNKNRAKLSKREGDIAVKDYLEKGYLKEALLNFVALLGWHPSKSDKEIFTLEELIQEFKLEEVQKGSAFFDLEKLNWFQKIWVNKFFDESKDHPESHPLYEKIKTAFESKYQNIDKQLLFLLWPYIIERVGSPADLESLTDEFSFFFEESEYPGEMLVWKKSDQEKTKKVLTDLSKFLKELPEDKWERGELEKEIKEYIAQTGFDNGTVLWPLRVALSGKEKSMGPFEIMDILNKAGKREGVFEKINRAINKI